MRKSVMSGAAALVLVSTLMAGPALAAPGEPPSAIAPVAAQCGTLIAAHTEAYLASDLHCPLTMAAGSTLDLKRHSLIGSGASSGDAITYQDTAGETTTPNITLKNGTVTNWGRVFGNIDGPGMVLRQMMISNVATAFSGFHSVIDADYTVFANNGAVVDGGIVGATVNHSAFINNTGGISSYFAGFLTVANSMFMGNGTAINCTQQQVKITGSSFIRNTVAVNLRGCSGATVTDNLFMSNGTGVSSVLYSPCGPCSNPVAQQAISDQFLRNRFQSNSLAVNVLHSATLVANTFNRNTTALHSVALLDGSVPAQIAATSNSFTRNGAAIYLTSPSTLKANSAINNTANGIYAPAAIDLGGNVASGNGIMPQCTGVVCAAR